LARPLKE
jgi:hypothetical protein